VNTRASSAAAIDRRYVFYYIVLARGMFGRRRNGVSGGSGIGGITLNLVSHCRQRQIRNPGTAATI
jgi:hypothetical protein